MSDAWLPDLSRTAGPKYLAITQAIGAAIDRGLLRDGDRLPPQRELAGRLGVDLTTVTKAYDQARSRGMIAARGRAGSFILAPEAIAAGPPPLDTGMNMPPEPLAGSLASSWERTTSALLRATGAFARMHYQPSGGLAADRAAARALLGRFGLADAAEERIILTSGAQNALHAIVGTALQSGDVVACAPFIYPGFLALARRHGIELAPLPAMAADALDALCRRRPVKALYVTPTNDNPTTHTIDTPQRQAIAEVCRRHGVLVIEDDAYGQLELEPLPALASLLPGQAWYVASTSKSLSPALRVAFVLAPSLRDALAASAAVHETSIMAPPLNAALVTSWLQDGSYWRLVGETRGEAAARQALVAGILPPGSYAGDPNGYHLWLPLDPAQPAGVPSAPGLTVVPSAAFAPVPVTRQAMRISLGGPISRDELARALRLLDAQLGSAGLRPPLV